MTTLGRPVKPDEIVDLKATVTPPEVFDVVNELIALNWDGNRANFKLSDVKDKIRAKLGEVKLEWLDFEPIYRQSGWGVSYDRPAYNESYEANFTFKKK